MRSEIDIRGERFYLAITIISIAFTLLAVVETIFLFNFEVSDYIACSIIWISITILWYVLYKKYLRYKR